MGFRSGISDAVAVSPATLRRVALVIGVVFAFVALTTIVSADSGKSKAKFSATADVLAVGPGVGSSTAIDVKRHRKTGDIKKINVRTVNEAVFGAPTALGPCEDSDGGGACGAVGALLTGSSVLSLHTSNVMLKHVTPDAFASGVLTAAVGGAYFVETYSGTLKGKLQGAFVITGSVGVLAGDVKLKIDGTATYACFGFGGAVPLPDLTDCEAGEAGTLFLPVILNVVDTGKFKIEPDPGTVIADTDHELVKMTGKLEVTVNAAFAAVLPGSVIEITKAKAKFVMSEDAIIP